MCLDKLSVAMLDSSEKCRTWLSYATELQEIITKLTAAVIWLFWIQLLGISIAIAHLSLAFPALLKNSYFYIYLCSPHATFQFTSKVI